MATFWTQINSAGKDSPLEKLLNDILIKNLVSKNFDAKKTFVAKFAKMLLKRTLFQRGVAKVTFTSRH